MKLIIFFVFFILIFSAFRQSGQGVRVKPRKKTKKPNIGPAPQKPIK